MARLLVVRHAQSQWNAAGRWQGWSDAPLSELGVAQAAKAGRALGALGAKPDLVVSSDLLRARRTAEIIASELGYTAAIVVDPDLREQNLGEWNGLTGDEIEARWPGQLKARRDGQFGPVPGGEPAEHFVARALAGISRAAAATVEEAVVVAHGGVVIALEQALGVWAQGNRHGNLSGWWARAEGTAHEMALVAVGAVDLLAPSDEMVSGCG